MGKRNRDEFEESKHAPGLSSRLKREIIETFNENIIENGYYSENSDYDEEQEEAVQPPEPLSPEVLRSSSSSANSPSDFGSPIPPESPANLLDAICSDDDYTAIAAQRARDVAPRGEWEEDDLCQSFSAAFISETAIRPAPIPIVGENADLTF